jgi:hypothetical protein
MCVCSEQVEDSWEAVLLEMTQLDDPACKGMSSSW